MGGKLPGCRAGILLIQHCARLVSLSVKAGNQKAHYTAPFNIFFWLRIYTWPLANLWVMDQGHSLRVEFFALEQAHIELCMEFSFSFFTLKKDPRLGEVARLAERVPHRLEGLSLQHLCKRLDGPRVCKHSAVGMETRGPCLYKPVTVGMETDGFLELTSQPP